MSWMRRLSGLFRGGVAEGVGAEETSPPCDIACHEALERLYEFLDGEMEAPSAEAVERHFRLCQRCYPALAMEESFRQALLRARDGATAPPDLMDRVLRILQDSDGGSPTG